MNINKLKSLFPFLSFLWLMLCAWWGVFRLFANIIFTTSGTYFLLFVASGFYENNINLTFTWLEFIETAYKVIPFIFVVYVGLLVLFISSENETQ